MAVRGLALALAALAIVASCGPALAAGGAASSPKPSHAVAIAPDFAADIATAKELTRKGRSREAIALLAADYKIDPTNRDVTVAFAQAYSYSGDQGRAISLLDKLLDANPVDVDARIVLAQAYAYNHDYASAEEQYQKVLATAPSDSDAQVGLAQTYTFEGRYDDAKKLYSAVLVHDPKNYDALVGLAGAQSFSGDMHGARANYQTVLDAQPDNADALVGLATLEYWSNNLPAAIALDNRALTLNPGDSDARDLKRQLSIKTSPQLISTMTTSHSNDGSTSDFKLSERFFAAPTMALGLVEEVYRLSNSAASVQTHRLGIAATYQQSSRLGVDVSLLSSRYGGVGAVTDGSLALFGTNNGLGYGLGVSNGGVDGSVTANGGQTRPDQRSALVRISSLFGNLGYSRRGSAVTFAALAAAYNDGNRYHEYSLDASHQFNINSLTSLTPDLLVRAAGFSETYNNPAQAQSPGYYSFDRQHDISVSLTAARQITDRFSIGTIGTLGWRRTVAPVYRCTPKTPWKPQQCTTLDLTPGTLPYQRLQPFLDYEGDRFSLAGSFYDDHYAGGYPVGSYAASTIDITFSIRLP